MHQLRVHLAHCGFPIVGDKLYSGNGTEYLEWMADGWTRELEGRLILPRHALHAARLVVPWGGKMIGWKAGLPQDFEEFIEGREISKTPDLVIWDRHD